MIEGKNIGVLGLGEYATKYYIQKIQTLWFKKYGREDCPLKMHQADFETINSFLPFGFKEIAPILNDELKQLNTAGINRIIIPNITLHLTLDRMELSSEIRDKIIDPFHETIMYLKAKSISKISLLGTRHTMNCKLIEDYFTKSNIIVQSISSEDRKEIDELRLQIFEIGPSADLKKKLSRIGEKYSNPTLICTELSALDSSFIDVVTCQLKATI